MENNMSKGRDKYPTTVTSSYNLILEWHPVPGIMQGGSLQRNNHLSFAQHNEQCEGKITTKIYKNITCYKYGQLGHYSSSCPLKEDEQGKFKEKGSNLDNIMQGVKRVMTGISIMHVDHEADKSNKETE